MTNPQDPSDSLFLGFDGGATKTAGAALNSEKKLVAEAAGAAANFQIIGVEKASENILIITESILKKANADFPRIHAMFLGLTGAGRPDDAKRMRDGFIEFLDKRNLPVPKVQVGSDAIAALEGAFTGKPGMILISGTGSILFAKNGTETIHRVGGWGRFIGDEGSGYAIGKACLTAIAKEFDGRGKKTMMSQLLKEKKTISDPQSLIVEIYQKNFDIAAAAPIAIEAAEKGDEAALEIMTESAAQLAEHVGAIVNKLKEPLPLAFIGSILTTKNILSQKLRNIIEKNFPEIKIQEAESSPAVGAALLAFKIEEVKP